MAKFKKEYARLNSAQKQAVDTIDGPLLVVAGPGTGKTQLLSLRVANILKSRDVSPGNILCLTFTNKAATNMRERLQSIIGNAGYQVGVKTFHSFAAEVMNQYPQYFWSGARLAIAPDAVQLHTIDTILRRLPHDNQLSVRFGGRHTNTEKVKDAIKLAKEAGLNPDKLRAIINFNLSYIDEVEAGLADMLTPAVSYKKLDSLMEQIAALPKHEVDSALAPLLSMSTTLQEGLAFAVSQDQGTNKTKHVGEWKKQWLQKEGSERGMLRERRRNLWWLQLADVYDQYQGILQARGYYDYADMILQVIQQAETHEELRASLQERYQYILIDEFQDTNAAQLRLSQIIANTGDNPPNLMAVGDDDQSIFKFNGAELNNMLYFQRTFPDTKLIVLTHNYRSTQAILDSAKEVIELSADRLVKRQPELSKELQAAHPPQSKGTIEHAVYASPEHQMSLLARRIQKQWSKQQNLEIAVLARNHDSLVRMASILLKLGVPVHYERSNNVLEHEAVQEIIRFANIIAAIQKGDEDTINVGLADSLRHPMWELTPKQLWDMALENYSRAHWLKSLRSSKIPRLNHFATWLEELARQAKTMPLGLMMEYLLGLRAYGNFASPVRSYFTRPREADDEYLRTLSALQQLRVMSDDFAFGARANLLDFVNLVQLHMSKEKIISDESAFVSKDKAVYLSTVHKAKGLEFDVVYVLDAVESEWQPRASGSLSPINLPLRPHGDDMDDYARLMYVALTRAKHSFVASSYAKDTAGEEKLSSRFIQPITRWEVQPSSQDENIVILEEHLAWPRLELKDEKQALHPILEDYTMSVTHLINYLDVTKGGPRYFFERNILRLPEAKSATLAYGTAIHNTLEEAQNSTNTGTFNLENIKKFYQKALAQQALPAEEQRPYEARGAALIERLFNDYHYGLQKGSLPEQKISDVRIQHARLNGKLDRIDLLPDRHLRVVDYKTGTPLLSFESRAKSNAYKVWQHKLQLVFYALLLKNTPRWNSYGTIEGQMVYLEAKSANGLERSYTPTAEEIDRLEKLVTVVWNNIMDLDFPEVSTYSPDATGIKAFETDLLEGKI